jgi:hypothetical protein
MGEPRSAGGVRNRPRRTAPPPPHYLTSREADAIARRARQQDEKRGIFRRWNDRKLTPAERRRAARQRPPVPPKPEP